MSYILPLAAFIILLVSSWDWICKDQSWRPSLRGWLVIVCGIIVLFFGWYQIQSKTQENIRLLKSIEREGTRLLPSDFQVKLDTWAHVNAFIHSGVSTSDYTPPERVALSMSIDAISISGTLVLRPKPARDGPPGRGSTSMHWYYYATDLFVEGLNKLTYLDELEGKKLTLYIPRYAFGKPFTSKLAVIRAHISIKGREFTVKHEEPSSGSIEIEITRNILNKEV